MATVKRYKGVPAEWKRLFEVGLPGYDPADQAGAVDSWFDPERAEHIVGFFEHVLTHVEGHLAGRPFLLEDWQKGYLGALVGWRVMHRTGTPVRRYRESMLYVPRKNGKTPMCAGITLYELVTSKEKGAQIYGAAADSAQAQLLYRQAKGMVFNEPKLEERLEVYGGMSEAGVKAIRRPEANSVYKVITSKASTKHGMTSSLILVDELHALDNRELVDVLRTSMSSANRLEPLMVYLTTADFERPSVCNEVLERAKDICSNGNRPDQPGFDPRFLPCLWYAENSDDWTSLDIWKKANPNFGVSVDEDYFVTEVARAKSQPAIESAFKRLHLNMRTQAATRWVPLDDWDRCFEADIDWSRFEGEPCFLGLDLASKLDLTAAVLIFPTVDPEDPGGDPLYYVKPHFWIPRASAEDRILKENIPYDVWEQRELITFTGRYTATDYDLVRDTILQWARHYDIEEVSYDPYNATYLATKLIDEGLPMVEFPQNIVHLNEPSKEFYRLVVNHKIRHDGHAVLRWNVDCCEVITDRNQNIRPIKPKEFWGKKIDGVVATVLGIGRAMVNTDVMGGSAYSGRSADDLIKDMFF